MTMGMRAMAGAYLGITSVYGTVYLSCMFVPREIEDALWYVTVDQHASGTFIVSALIGAFLANWKRA